MCVNTDKIRLKDKSRLVITKALGQDHVTISLQLEGSMDVVFHWGVLSPDDDDWHLPPETIWPQGTRPFDDKAVQTPFVQKNGAGTVVLELDRNLGITAIPFVLYFPEKKKWDNNKGRNYHVDLPGEKKEPSSLPPLAPGQPRPGTAIFHHLYFLEDGAQLSVTAVDDGSSYHVDLATNMPEPVILHWGTAMESRRQWQVPAKAIQPGGTDTVDNKAAQTPFTDDGTERIVHLVIPKKDAPLGIPFVLKDPQSNHWFNDSGRDFYIPLTVPEDYENFLGDPVLADLADTIVERETGNHSWTLMHRYNLCHDLTERVSGNEAGWALLFVWLRYSAIRQLDWQRNFNTKPRELAHALDRLTRKLSQCYAGQRSVREYIRLMLTTLGRGGEGQRVRDEILHIMHRHHIKEIAGHFMEEWHQKLHNNTTPDDVVICEAYLDFYRHDGALDRFYKILEKGGVSRDRLRSYDRPIHSDPDFIPHLKEALIHDFEQFLRILKGVHAGTDLDSATQAAAHVLDPALMGIVEEVQNGTGDGRSLSSFATKVTKAREALNRQIDGQKGDVRDLLFLDLALEDHLRLGFEQHLQHLQTLEAIVPLIGPMMANLLLSHPDEEIRLCLRHWQSLEKTLLHGEAQALEAKAVFDRMARSLGRIIDGYEAMFQPKAELLGKAFNATSWSITLFTEEVTRGRPVFLLAALLKKMDPLLRQKAHLGHWQIVSAGEGAGRIKTVALKDIQQEIFQEPTIIVTPQITGNEEIPEGVTAVITHNSVDIVSHVAIRARNAPILFATCYDESIMAEISTLEGDWVHMASSPSGDVLFERSHPENDGSNSKSGRRQSLWEGHQAQAPLTRARFTSYALSMDAFNENTVGAKSNHLKNLQGKLPSWIRLPDSAAVPFGAFEKALSHDMNRETATAYVASTAQLETAPMGHRSQGLEKIRQTVMSLKAPEPLREQLAEVVRSASLPWSPRDESDWQAGWTCIKHVWASKWNERAYVSRKTMGIAHDDLSMAVLIQKVVAAEYAFVIHTVNPITGAEDEIFAEIVPGLGETLVGNYPGRALSFSCKKEKNSAWRIHTFPGKSMGLFGQGIIFRSDSNGEDLSRYAGAGLYDSVTLSPTEEVLLDYTRERILTDSGFQEKILSTIVTIGCEVEKAMGGPQDIEGAFSEEHFYVVQTRPQIIVA